MKVLPKIEMVFVGQKRVGFTKTQDVFHSESLK